MEKTRDTTELWTVGQARDALGLSKWAGYALLHKEGVPVVLIGKKRYFHRELLLQWLREHANAQGVE